MLLYHTLIVSACINITAAVFMCCFEVIIVICTGWACKVYGVCVGTHPSPRARMWVSSSEGMNILRNSAENTPPFFIAPVFLMLRDTDPERFGWRKWNSLWVVKENHYANISLKLQNTSVVSLVFTDKINFKKNKIIFLNKNT